MKLLGVGDSEVDIMKILGEGLVPSDSQHLRRLVGEEHKAGGPDDFSGWQARLAGAAGDVQDAVAGLDTGQLQKTACGRRVVAAPLLIVLAPMRCRTLPVLSLQLLEGLGVEFL